MHKRVSGLLAALAITGLVLSSAPAANAAPTPESSGVVQHKATPKEVAELQKLQKIAGKPVTYQQAPSGTSGKVVTTQGFDPFVCNLHPSVVHPRSSSNKGSVGAKPYTKCLAGTPSRITHTSVLYMVEWFGLSWVPLASKPQTGANTRYMQLNSLEWFCNNRNTSTFAQKTSGTSVQLGRTYYASVSTVKTPLACGR